MPQSPRPGLIFKYPNTYRVKYFLHDTSASDDEKIAELFIEFGYEGIGLFYTMLEKMAKQEKPIKTTVLKTQLKVGKRLEKCWEFLHTIGLVSSNNGETFNERILSYSESYKIKKEKTREKIAEWRKNQEDKKNVTGYKSDGNHSKVKESKVKESKDIIGEPQAAKSDDFIRFEKWILENAPDVSKMKQPFTETEYFKIKEKHPAEKIVQVLKDMHNKVNLTKNYKSAYLTASKWLKNDYGTQKTQSLFPNSNGKLGTSEAQRQAHLNY